MKDERGEKRWKTGILLRRSQKGGALCNNTGESSEVMLSKTNQTQRGRVPIFHYKKLKSRQS